MTRTAALTQRKRKAVLRAADARRAARAAVEAGCEVEVLTESGLRFRFRPLGEAAPPERNPWDDAEP